MSLVESDDPALVVLPPASGLAERRRARREVARRRRRRRIAVAVTLVWVALVGWSLLSARSAASTATADARAVAADFAGADAAELQEVVGDLDRVVSRLNDPWVYPLRLVPWVGRQVIVTDDLVNTISLEDYCAPWPGSPPPYRVRLKLLLKLADSAGRMHRAGINHRDFYICHFHLDPATLDQPTPRCHMIDLPFTALDLYH